MRWAKGWAGADDESREDPLATLDLPDGTFPQGSPLGPKLYCPRSPAVQAHGQVAPAWPAPAPSLPLLPAPRAWQFVLRRRG